MANGAVERQNKTLATILSIYVNKQHTDWDEYIPYAVFAYNNHVQDSTKYSPFFLLHGRECKLPLDTTLNFVPNRYTIDVDDYALEMPRLMSEAWASARSNNDNTRQKQKVQYNKDACDHDFKIDKRVLKTNTYMKPGLTKKLVAKYVGPFIIRKIRYPLLYIVPETNEPTETGKWIHVNGSRLTLIFIRRPRL